MSLSPQTSGTRPGRFDLTDALRSSSAIPDLCFTGLCVYLTSIRNGPHVLREGAAASTKLLSPTMLVPAAPGANMVRSSMVSVVCESPSRGFIVGDALGQVYIEVQLMRMENILSPD